MKFITSQGYRKNLVKSLIEKQAAMGAIPDDAYRDMGFLRKLVQDYLQTSNFRSAINSGQLSQEEAIQRLKSDIGQGWLEAYRVEDQQERQLLWDNVETVVRAAINQIFAKKNLPQQVPQTGM